MNCRKARSLIQLELDGELSPGRGRRLAAHLAGCPACCESRRQHLAIQAACRGMAGGFDADRPIAFAAVRPRGGLGPRLAVALAAAVAAGMGLWWTAGQLTAPRAGRQIARQAPPGDRLLVGGGQLQSSDADQEGVQERRPSKPSGSPAGNEAQAQLMAARQPARAAVHVWLPASSDQIVVPVPSHNPDVSIFWIYPAIRTAQAPADVGKRGTSINRSTIDETGKS